MLFGEDELNFNARGELRNEFADYATADTAKPAPCWKEVPTMCHVLLGAEGAP